MTKEKTAGKTAKKRAASANGNKANAGRKARKPRKKSITVTVDGERYRNLDRIARAMNGVAWCDKDNTPETVFEEFILPCIEDILGSVEDLGGYVLAGIATGENGANAPEPTHSARIEELRAAFDELEEPLMSKIAALLPRSCGETRTA